MRPVGRQVRRELSSSPCASRSPRRRCSGSGTRSRATLGIAGTLTLLPISERGTSRTVHPAGERIDRRRQRVEIAAEPARADRVGGIGGGPDVRAEKVRAARVRIARCAESARGARRRRSAAARSAADAGRARGRTLSVPTCSTLAGRHGDRRPAAVVERVGVRDRACSARRCRRTDTARRGCGATRPARARDPTETPAPRS